MHKKSHKTPSDNLQSEPELTDKKSGKAAAKQKDKAGVSYNKMGKANAPIVENFVDQNFNVDMIINEEDQPVSHQKEKRTSNRNKKFQEDANSSLPGVLGKSKKVEAPSDLVAANKIDLTTKNASKISLAAKNDMAVNKLSSLFGESPESIQKQMNKIHQRAAAKSKKQAENPPSANIEGQDNQDDAQMVAPLDNAGNVDDISEEIKEPNAGNGPKLSKYGRSIASKTAEKAKENDERVKEALYPSGDEGNDSSESENEQDVEAQVDINEDQDPNVEKKRYPVVIKEHKQLLKDLTSNFTIPYGEAPVRDHPDFSQYLQDQRYMDSVKSFCNFRYFKYIRGDTTRIPKTKVPNEVLVDLFRGRDLKLIQHLAWTLEKFVNPKILAHISTEYVKEAVNRITDIYNPNDVSLAILQVCPQLKLRAVAEVLGTVLDPQQNQIKIVPQTWFHTCIVPALEGTHRIDLNSFSIKNIMHLKEVCDASRLNDLKKNEAVIYASLLKKADAHCLDSFYSKMGTDDGLLWTEILTTVYGFSLEFAQLALTNKETLITTAAYDYHRQYNPPLDFFRKVAKFQRMTYQELVQLGELSVDYMLDIFLDLMPSQFLQDFSAFSLATRVLRNYKAPVQISTMKTSLKDRPLKEWSSYEKLVQCTLNYTQGDDSLEIVKKALARVSVADKMTIGTEDAFVMMKKHWAQAFDAIQSKKKILQMDWQQHIVFQLNFQIAAERDVMVSIGTGHGKSIIIQLLADMQAMGGTEVIVVCLNRFLAYWAQSTYGSPYVANFMIRYMDLYSFLQTTPNKKTIVYCDEIDQMVGSQSFKLAEEHGKIEAIYFPSFLQEWGRVVGFSGTMSDATVQQLRCFFPKAFNLTIPSLRKYGSENKLTKVMVVTPEHPLTSLVKFRMNELKSSSKNFIILTKDEEDLKKMVDSLKESDLVNGKLLVVIPSYESNFQFIAAQIRSLKTSEFIIVTTKEGGIAVDFQGVENAHTIECFTPKTSSQLIQGIGRGSRDLQSSAEGTIITSDPLTTDASAYIDQLEIQENEKNHSLLLNSKVARALHRFQFDVIDEQLLSQMKWFQRHFKKAEDFRYDDFGLANWSRMKNIIKDVNMPVKPFDNWDQK